MKGELTAIIDEALEGGYWQFVRRCLVQTARVRR